MAPRSGTAGARNRVVQAVDQVAEWRRLAKDYGRLAVHYQETFAWQALEAARNGLAAWDELPADSRRKAKAVQDRSLLISGRTEAVQAWLKAASALDYVLLETTKPRLTGLNAHDMQAWRKLRDDVCTWIKEREERPTQIQAAHDALVAGRRGGPTSAQADLDASFSLLAAYKHDDAGMRLYLCTVRLMCDDLTGDVAQAYTAFHTDLMASVEQLGPAGRTLLDNERPAAERTAAAAIVRRTSERWAALAENLCLAAAQALVFHGASDSLWADTLACADAVSDRLLPLLELVDADTGPPAAASSSSAAAPAAPASGADDWAVAWPGRAARPAASAPKGRRARARARLAAQASAGSPTGMPGPQTHEPPLAPTDVPDLLQGPAPAPAAPAPAPLDVAAADAIKRQRFPEAWDLERLLDLGQIGHVTRPRRLRSHGDRPERDLGRLFEMEIRPRPLSDGTPADPLYLHLHTEDLIDPPACHERPYGGFAAVHVKTEAQRRLGATWERAQRTLGRLKAKVHRARVGEGFLVGLRALVVSAPAVPRGARQRAVV